MLTGLVSLVDPGSMTQIIVAALVSLGFFTMHTRCYPFTDDSKNVLKLGTELALMIVFLATARSPVLHHRCPRFSARIQLPGTQTTQNNVARLYPRIARALGTSLALVDAVGILHRTPAAITGILLSLPGLDHNRRG